MRWNGVRMAKISRLEIELPEETLLSLPIGRRGVARILSSWCFGRKMLTPKILHYLILRFFLNAHPFLLLPPFTSHLECSLEKREDEKR